MPSKSIFIAALATLFLLQACAPPQRIYSVDPVDKVGRDLPLDHTLGLVFENDEEVLLRPGEQLVILDDGFEILEPDEDRTGPVRWPVSKVAQLLWKDSDGVQDWIDILTPDDLLEIDPVPRIYEIEMKDGEILDFIENDHQTRWSASGIELELYEDTEVLRTIPLEDVRTVTLYDASLVDSTLKSPVFWVVGAAAAGVFWLISDDASDRDNATR